METKKGERERETKRKLLVNKMNCSFFGCVFMSVCIVVWLTHKIIVTIFICSYSYLLIIVKYYANIDDKCREIRLVLR